MIKRIKIAAREAGVSYQTYELARHTGFAVGSIRTTLGRHSEVDEISVVTFFRQFEDALGEGWWRR